MLARDVGLPEADALATARQPVQDPRAAVGDHHCKPPKRQACGAAGDRPRNPQATSEQLPDEDVDELLAERPAAQGHDEEHRAPDLEEQVGSDEQPVFGDRLDNLDTPAFQVDPASGQGNQLAPPQTGVRQDLDQRPVRCTGLRQGLHLVVGQETLGLSDNTWERYADYPTPAAAAHLAEARMAAFLRRHHYRGGKTPAELVARLRAAPVAPAGLPTATLAAMVTAQVQLLRTLQQLISDTERLIAARVVAYPRTRMLADLPGVGMINLAQLLAEVGPILDRVDSAEQAATECGAAPVTRASGKTSGVYFRWAANTRARKAITSFAHNARLQDSWAAKLYADARARGKRHPHATRIVARAWLRVIWACWTTQQPYDPSRHRTSTSSHPPVPPPPANPAGAQARSRWSTPRLNDLDRAEHRHTIKRGGTPMAIDLTERTQKTAV